MKYHASLAAAAAAAMLCAPAAAQDAPAPEAEAAPAGAPQDAAVAAPASAPLPECELHVFPTIEAQALTTGWLSGLGAIGAVADAASNKNKNVSNADYLRNALGPEFQVESLKTIDLLAALKLPASQIIYETPIADRKITTRATNRLTASTAGCYVELIVTQNFYTKKPIYGRSLNNRFIFKDFRGGKEQAELVKGRGGNGLSHFPPKSEDENAAAEQDLRLAFTKNFLEFSKKISSGK